MTNHAPTHPLGVPPAIGGPAPDLIVSAGDRPIHLRHFRGHPVVVAFFSDDWDPARREYLALFNRLLAGTAGSRTRLLTLALEGEWCRMAFSDGEEQIPLVRLDSGGAAAHAWGVYGGQAFYLVDARGIVRWRHLAPAGEQPRADELVAAVAALAPPIAYRGAEGGAEGGAGKGTEVGSHTGGAATRREFVALTLLATVALALPSAVRGETVTLPAGARPTAAARPVKLSVNGRELSLMLEPQVTLLDALREYAGLTGTKKGCDHGQCGACTVHVEGRRVLSCLTLAMMVEGRKVTTIEGLARNGELHPMQAAFVKHDGFQCGYCTPGQIMSAVAVLDEPCGPSDTDVRECMSGNICRCGAYPNIVAAIQDARGGRAG